MVNFEQLNVIRNQSNVLLKFFIYAPHKHTLLGKQFWKLYKTWEKRLSTMILFTTSWTLDTAIMHNYKLMSHILIAILRENAIVSLIIIIMVSFCVYCAT